jgi:DNA invertase Pin-like site-specific DNA recombinase
VVTKLDSLGRSLEHLIDLSNELQRGVDLVVLDQGINTSPRRRMLFQMIGSIA